MRGENMETATEIEIKQAMGVLGLENWSNDLLDEIELDRRLKISEEQFRRGETLTVEEMKKRTTERLNNGYYLR
jgi:hypothetical protein